MNNVMTNNVRMTKTVKTNRSFTKEEIIEAVLDLIIMVSNSIVFNLSLFTILFVCIFHAGSIEHVETPTTMRLATSLFQAMASFVLIYLLKQFAVEFICEVCRIFSLEDDED